MDDRFLTPSRLAILRQIAKGISTPSQIAKGANVSLPYVITQVQLLEAKEFITKQKAQITNKPGKPATSYTLANHFIHMLLTTNDFCEKITFSHAPSSALHYLQIVSFIQNHIISFSKYYWSHSEDFDHILALALIEYEPQKVQFLAICDSKDLSQLRSTVSHKKITLEKNVTEFVVWVHTIDEITTGLQQNDSYYYNLVSKMKIIFDDKKQLAKVQV